MRKVIIISAVALFLLTACGAHYQLTDVSHTRIVVDNRYDAQADTEAIAFLTPYKQKVDEMMGPVVGEVACDMTANRPESSLSNLLTDIFMYMAKDYREQPDFAVYNMGGIRAALSKGPVTYGDVLDVAPFENKISFVTLSGVKVKELFEQIAKRGGEGVSHGVELVITRDGQLLSAKLHGKEIDPAADYRVTTIDYLAQGNDGLTAFKDGTRLSQPKSEDNNARYVIRDYFLKMQQQGVVVDSKVEGRIIVK